MNAAVTVPHWDWLRRRQEKKKVKVGNSHMFCAR